MLYLAIPAHNEVATIGVLLWRLRTVLAEFPREYEVVVYDDASTDETAVVAEQYVHAMPVTVLRGTTPVGYAGAVNALVRHVAAHTRYPRRDAMLLLQGDFTDPPGIVPEFARRFEGGADLVVGERTAVVDAPVPVRRLFSAAGWALRPFVKVEGIRDLTGSMRLMRIQALRDLLRTVGDDAVCAGDSWTANADLLLRLVPHARRVESVPMEPTYGVRTRDTRRVTVRDALAALRWGWRARGRRAVPTSAPETGADVARGARPASTSRRRDEPEVTADRLRERSRDRDRLRGEVENPRSRRDGRPEREGREVARTAQTAEQKAERRDRKRDEKVNGKRGEKRPEDRNGKRAEKREQSAETKPEQSREARANESRPAEPRANDARAARPPRADKQQRRDRKPPLAVDPDLFLDDPFAGPSRSQAAPTAPPSPSSADAAEQEDERPKATTPPRDEVEGLPADAGGVSSVIEVNGRDADGADDVGDDDAEDAAAESTDAAGDDASSRERKRRRNRRSRRRRSKHRGDSGDAVSEATTGDDTSDASREPDAREHDARARSVEANTRDDSAHDPADRHDTDRDDAGDDDDAGTDAADGSVEAGDAGTKDHAARARRRGRRGRRGGSRRSRTRGRDGGNTDGPASEGPSAPPPGDVA